MKSPQEIAARVAYRGRYDAQAESADNVIGLKLRQARKDAGLTVKELAAAMAGFGLPITDKAVSKWEGGHSTPNPYQLVALCLILGIDDIRALMRAHTPRLNREGLDKVLAYADDLAASGRYAPRHTSLPVREQIRTAPLRVALLPPSAGTGQYLDSDEVDIIDYPADRIPEGTDLAFHIAGDSMEPVYHDGQLVFVQLCSRVDEGRVGIFLYDGSSYIKVYREEPDGDGCPRPVLVSYNTRYAPIQVNPELGFSTVGRVLN